MIFPASTQSWFFTGLNSRIGKILWGWFIVDHVMSAQRKLMISCQRQNASKLTDLQPKTVPHHLRKRCVLKLPNAMHTCNIQIYFFYIIWHFSCTEFCRPLPHTSTLTDYRPVNFSPQKTWVHVGWSTRTSKGEVAHSHHIPLMISALPRTTVVTVEEEGSVLTLTTGMMGTLMLSSLNRNPCSSDVVGKEVPAPSESSLLLSQVLE